VARQRTTARDLGYDRRFMRRAFVTSLLFAFAGFALLFGVEFLLEWNAAGRPGLPT
jgi:hypothetical protein